MRVKNFVHGSSITFCCDNAEHHYRCPEVFNKNGNVRQRAQKLLTANRKSDGKFAPHAAADARELNKGYSTIMASMALGGRPIRDPEEEDYEDEQVMDIPREVQAIYAQLVTSRR